VLAGTLAVRDPQAGLAIVGETAQSGHVYAVGASLPGGVRLHEVYSDRVVLDRGGVLETLPLPRSVASGSPRRVAAGGAEPPIGEAVQKLIAGGPEVVGDVLRPMPSYANGKLMGFRVYAGRDRRKFAKLGLQPGDVVTQVNGVPLGDSQHGLDALRSLGGQSTATVTVERAGTATQLTIDASQLNGMSDNIPPAPTAAPAPIPAPATPAATDSSPD
jgi:general secretion pathway protein C